MGGSVNVILDFRSGRHKAEYELWDGSHVHRYADTVSGSGWSWCDDCQCFTLGKCDHRKLLCRDAKRRVQRKR